MDNERLLRTELRRALDDVLPPVPWLEAAVSEDLRKRRSRKSVDPGSALPRPSMQLVAGVLVVVLAVAALVTFVAIRNQPPRTAPAGVLSIGAYQELVNRDVNRLDSASAGDYTSCNTLQSICPALWKPVLTADQQWLEDLKRSEPPAKFAVIDGQLRRHLVAAIADVNAVLGAYQARDQGWVNYTEYASLRQGDWIDVLARSIVKWHVATAPAYVDSVRAAKQNLDTCQDCQQLGGTSPLVCAGMLISPCEGDVAFAKSAIQIFEAAVISVAAPPSLAARDSRLQDDLAKADTGILAMANAEAAGNPAAFNAGRLLFQQALASISADIADIVGG